MSKGVIDEEEEEPVELAALLLGSMAATVATGVVVDETMSVLEAKEAAILEAISSASIDGLGVVDIKITVVKAGSEEELAGATT